MQYSHKSKGNNNNSGAPVKKGSFGGKSQINPLAKLQQKTKKEEENEGDESGEEELNEPSEELKLTYVPKSAREKPLDNFYKSLREEMQAIAYTIRGLTYLCDFITQDEENAIVEELDGKLKENWDLDLKRRVQQYGYKFIHSAQDIDIKNPAPPIPEILHPMMKKLVDMKLFPKLPDQVIINEYEPGQGINPHVDRTHCFDEPVVSVSLLSGTMMDFRNNKTLDKKSIYLEPCSLVLLMGQARYNWTHGIPGREFDEIGRKEIKRSRRISVTFRIMKQEYLAAAAKKQ